MAHNVNTLTGLVYVDLEEWEEIQEQLSWLDALEAAGVDNWDGIDTAQKIFRENNPEMKDD